MRSIFIIGQHRTGSTLLKNILDANTEVTMAFDEMNLFEPFRNNTLNKFFENDNITSRQLINYISQKQVYGTFWQNFERSGITFTELKSSLDNAEDLTSQCVIKVILQLLSKNNETRISGVKYPLHIRKLEYLFNHFPDSKIIFLTRNPAAIIASKLNDEATQKRKDKSFIHHIFIHYFTVFYFLLEYKYSVKTFFKYREHLKLVTYEELVTDQHEIIFDLCDWCGLQFEEQMLEVAGKSSSHHSENSKGLHTQSVDKYKDILNSFDIELISLLTNRYYKKIENEFSTNL